MTTVNKSLAYIDNTIVYNNEYELNFSYEYYPYQTLFEDTGVYYSSALQTANYVRDSADFTPYTYGVISFNHSGKSNPVDNLLAIDWKYIGTSSQVYWMVNMQNNTTYKPVVGTWYGGQRSITVADDNLVLTRYSGDRSQYWYNDKMFKNNKNTRFKLIFNRNQLHWSAYWDNIYRASGIGQASGNMDILINFRLYHAENDNTDKFRISDIKAYGTDDFNIATGLA